MHIPKLSDMTQISDYLYEIPCEFRPDMLVSARVYMTQKIYQAIKEDRSLLQLVNMATLPGIQKYALAMPDIHQGYGFPIGGVLATSMKTGVISPGGIGYDINCGVRLLKSDISIQALKRDLPKLATALYRAVPSGVGRSGAFSCSYHDLDLLLTQGAVYLVSQGYGSHDDLLFCEEQGAMKEANSHHVSDHAKRRGIDQLGTLGSGNHFLEVQVVDEIFDQQAATAFGLSKDMITVMIHCGSRGLGHQVCTDYVKIMNDAFHDIAVQLPDRELLYAPIHSPQARDYFSAMSAASNFAWANRHLITHNVRQVWQKFFGLSVQLSTVYDLSHNIGKQEEHMINGFIQPVLVHRKGATRSFGPGRIEIPEQYRSVGQPVFIPGTMGTASYVLVGTTQGMEQSFGSSCHGAGRQWSRAYAKKQMGGNTVRSMLEKAGIIIRAGSDVGLAEEAPCAYKDVEEVVNVVHNAELARKVARLKPLAVIKGE